MSGFGWPWFGVDADWWQSGPDAMQAYALQKVRTCIVRPEDPRATSTRQAGTKRNEKDPAAARVRTKLAPLWRWQGPFRVMAVVAELSSRLRTHGAEVRWVGEDGGDGALVSHRIFALGALPTDHAFQIDKVMRAAVERQDRLPEILSQADEIGPFFDAVTGVDRSVAPRLAELLETAWEVATLVVMALKNHHAALRPFQRSDSVLPVIPTPGHGSLPSGHATMATLASELLCALRFGKDPQRCGQLDRLARRIAFNRVVAGVHFPIDSEVGYQLGRRLAAALVAAARGGDLPADEVTVVRKDATLRESDDRPAPVAVDPARPIEALGQWSLMWQAAVAELELLRV